MFPRPSMLLAGKPRLLFDILWIAGGGGGAGSSDDAFSGGYGGAGGFKEAFGVELDPGTYAQDVGAGGALATNGGNTTFAGFTLLGGGHGGAPVHNGSSGGSGGGGSSTSSGSTLGGAGTSSQGNAGAGGGFGRVAGGGGGAGGPAPSPWILPFKGGPGIVSSITGVPVEYCRGAPMGIGVFPTNPGDGGWGGVNPTGPTNPALAFGKDGLLAIRHPGPQACEGGIVTTITVSGRQYTLYRFVPTSTDDFVVP